MSMKSFTWKETQMWVGLKTIVKKLFINQWCTDWICSCFRVWHQRISNMLPAVFSVPCTSEMSRWHGLMPVACSSQSRTKMAERKRLLPSRPIILSSRKTGLLVSIYQGICSSICNIRHLVNSDLYMNEYAKRKKNWTSNKTRI